MNRLIYFSTMSVFALSLLGAERLQQTAPVTMRPIGCPLPSSGVFRKLQPTQSEATTPIFTPDWTASLSTPQEFDWFTVIDANGDADDSRGTWMWRDDARCAWYSYSYSAYGDKVDDWLVTPGLVLKSGKDYQLNFFTTNRSTFYDDKMEVFIGTQPTIEGMSTELIPSFSVMSSDWDEHSVEFTIPDDDIYYIGFRLSEAGYMSSVFIDEISVNGTPMLKSPDAVTDFTVTPDPSGASKATISFKAPEKCVDGSGLTSLIGVKIRNGYFDIEDITDVKPGDAVNYTVEMDCADTYTFNVVAYNEIDEGVNSSQTLYVGLDIPATPRNVVLHDEVDHIAVTADSFSAAHNGVFFPEEVDFNLYEITRDEYGYPAVGSLLATTRGDSSMTLPWSTVTGEQQIVSYVTNASNAAGESPNYYQTNSIVLGAPYSLPFEESFDNGTSSYFWMTIVTNNGFGNTGVYSSVIDSYNSRPGCMLLSAVNAGDLASFYTGKLDISGCEKPIFAFAVKRFATEKGTLDVVIRDPEGSDHLLATLNMEDIPEEWSVLNYDLSQFSNLRFVHIGLRYTPEQRDYNNQIWFDHLFVGELPDVDLNVEVSAPKLAERGSVAYADIRVNNSSSKPVDAFNLTVKANGKPIYSQSVEQHMDIMSSAHVRVPVNVLPIETASEIELYVEVTIDGDTNPSDNNCQAVIELRDPDLASATGLKCEDVEEGVMLTWDKVSDLAPYTDNFESYAPYNYYSPYGWAEHNVGEWTMVDVDGGSTGGFVDELWYGSQAQQFAYTVFNPYDYTGYGQSLFTVISEDVAASFIPYSGSQYLAGIYSANTYWDGEKYMGDIIDADNWVISPLQTGDAQTIKFHVNNFKGQSGLGYEIDHVETYQVLVSFDGMELDDFSVIGGDRIAAGGQWQEVEVELPEGTRYFAIRHCSRYNLETGSPFILMIDDITYSVPNKPVGGYNVYRDGQLIASVGKDLTEYIDPIFSNEPCLYQITVVYEDGTESAAVSYYHANTGISSIANDKTFDIYTSTGVLVRRGARDFSNLRTGIYVTSFGKKIIIK